jgi:hypothetical protein
VGGLCGCARIRASRSCENWARYATACLGEALEPSICSLQKQPRHRDDRAYGPGNAASMRVRICVVFRPYLRNTEDFNGSPLLIALRKYSRSFHSSLSKPKGTARICSIQRLNLP